MLRANTLASFSLSARKDQEKVEVQAIQLLEILIGVISTSGFFMCLSFSCLNEIFYWLVLFGQWGFLGKYILRVQPLPSVQHQDH